MAATIKGLEELYKVTWILWKVLEKKRWGLIFTKGVRCFEAKKAINHELKAHSHGGGGEEDEEERMMVVATSRMKEKGANDEIFMEDIL